MEALASWLTRLRTLQSEQAERVLMRLFAPGHETLDFDNWLMTTEQPTKVPPGFRGGGPETVALLAYLDVAGQSQNVFHQHRMAVDLATVMTLAFERRIDIPIEVAAQTPGGSVTFLPIGGMIDWAIRGPLPADAQERLANLLRLIGGLNSANLATIGSAASMFHSAVLLHDRDVRSAYAFLVAGIETLSRQYGDPPDDWENWEVSKGWDRFIDDQQLTTQQATALRARLMGNQQLRLKATFQFYGSTRVPDTLFELEWIEWAYPLMAPQGQWDAPVESRRGKGSDVVPNDRGQLSRMLGISYDLRSRYIHKGAWFGPMDVAANRPSVEIEVGPVPFEGLRILLQELILVEITDHSQGSELPDVQLQRVWQPQPPAQS